MLMDSSPACSRPRIEFSAAVVLCLLGLVISFFYAYYTIFSAFRTYDDEGFVLISLKFFFQGGALYDQVYSCYQPFFHVFDQLLFSLWGAPLCHDNIRLLTMALWLAGAAINAFITYRLTKSGLAALLVLVLSVQYLAPFSNEPGHPQSLAYLLVAGIVALFTSIGGGKARIAFACSVGVLTGLLILTKINIGIYTMLAVGLVLAAGTSGIIALWLQQAIGAIMVVLPACFLFSRLPKAFWSAQHIGILGILTLVLLAPLLLRGKGREWGFIAAVGCAVISLVSFPLANFYEFYFGVLLAFSIYSVVIISNVDRPDLELGYREWLWTVLGGTSAIVVVLSSVIVHGTSLHGLVEGMFLAPARLSTVFTMHSTLSSAVAPLCGLAGLASCCAYLRVRESLADRLWFHDLLAMAKIIFALAVVAGHDGWPPLLVSFVWLPLAAETNHPVQRMARLALVAVAAVQPLIAYPVCGSQCAPGSILLLVAAAVCLTDAMRTFKPRASGIVGPTWRRLAIGGIVALAILLPFGKQALERGRYYASLTPLDLPGASRIRLNGKDVRVLQDLVRRLARPDVETFLTLPGLNSLYLWAQKDPPTGFNVTDWMAILDDRCQEGIWDAARNRSGLMVVRNHGLAAMWGRHWPNAPPLENIPLVRHINDTFKTIETIGPYELMVRQ